MHKYKQIEFKAGITIEIIKCYPYGMRKGQSRQRVKKTKEEMQEANMRQAARKLARKINANFKPKDWHITLTYRRGTRPDAEQAKKNIKALFVSLRSEYKKSGFALKYICATEYLNKAIHHHLIINNINDGKRTTTDLIHELWKGKGNPHFEHLYDDGEYSQLASYLIKETEKTFRSKKGVNKQHYTCSRNLITPKPETKTITVKKGWEKEPSPRKGYYIKKDTLYNGFDKLGYPYQRYIMVKINPKENEWEPCAGFPPGD